jgi:hypothetical protein
MRIENIDDFTGALKQLGWTLWHDEVGDRCAEIRVNSLVLSVVIGWKDYRNNRFSENKHLVFSMGGSVTTDAASAVYTLMKYPKKRIASDCIILQREAPIIRKPVVTYHDVKEMSDDLILWATECDIDAGLANLFNQDANQSGAYPLRHLAALAANGNVETLTRYLESFKTGGRAGFRALYITEDYIKTALDFAQRRRADPNWLPNKPKMRV